VDGADVTLEPVASFTLPPDAATPPSGIAFTRPRGAPLARAFDRASCTAP
jgi:hypothetical protein